MKANASAVHSDLAGGTTGHLGLVLSLNEMALITAIQYIRHLHPGILVIQPGTTLHEADRLRDEYKEAMRLFKEMIELEKLLKKQSVL